MAVGREASARWTLARLRLGLVSHADEALTPVVGTLLYSLTLYATLLRIGRFFFEKNKPATFKHPLYSFLGDLKLWREVVTLQRRP